jgi:hypothetical protein
MRDRKRGSARVIRRARILPVGLLLTLLAPHAAPAQSSYTVQPIARLLDTVGEAQITLDGWFEVGDLTDHGQLLFATLSLNDAGGKNLLQYADGKFLPIALPGGAVIDRMWPLDLDVSAPVSASESGRVVFAATAALGGKPAFGTFLWENGTRAITAVALAGMPAVDDLTFDAGALHAPAINGSGQIAFGAKVRNAAGQVGDALFLQSSDGKLAPVALPGQELPGGGAMIGLGGAPSLNEAGRVAFLGVRSADTAPGAYLWENGVLSPVALVGAETSEGNTIERVTGVWVNDRDRSVLVAARDAASGSAVDALFRFTDGKLLPVVASGQQMPGGGTLQSLQPFSVSRSNALGQHAFLALLGDNTTAAYLLDADDKLTLILKEGDAADAGRITQIGARPDQPMSSFGVGLNSSGQVALPARVDGSADTLLLLTPNAA